MTRASDEGKPRGQVTRANRSACSRVVAIHAVGGMRYVGHGKRISSPVSNWSESGYTRKRRNRGGGRWVGESSLFFPLVCSSLALLPSLPPVRSPRLYCICVYVITSESLGGFFVNIYFFDNSLAAAVLWRPNYKKKKKN